jgi:hypothetical protein
VPALMADHVELRAGANRLCASATAKDHLLKRLELILGRFRDPVDEFLDLIAADRANVEFQFLCFCQVARVLVRGEEGRLQRLRAISRHSNAEPDSGRAFGFGTVRISTGGSHSGTT